MLDFNGFWDVVKLFRVQLDACQRVLNPAFVPSQAHLELFVNAFLRSYMLACFHDLYTCLGVALPRFTPAKVQSVLDSAMPKLLLDAMRELIRPQVTPDGLLLVPSPMNFINDTPYDADSIVRNSVRLGPCDQELTRYGILWFKTLPHCFRAAWMTGTEDGQYALTFVENTKREGLEPAKLSALVRIVKVKEDDAKARQKMEDEFGSLIVSKPADEKKLEFKLPHIVEPELKLGQPVKSDEDWSAKFWANKVGDAPASWSQSIIKRREYKPGERSYWMHDFDGITDARRDFAMRILKPYVWDISDDVWAGRVQIPIVATPASLAMLGVDTYRGAVPYTIWQFQTMKDLMEGDPTIISGDYYLNRWIAELSQSLKDWHFPRVNESSPSKAADSGARAQFSAGKKPRRRKDRKPPDKQGSAGSQAAAASPPGDAKSKDGQKSSN